jgi:hypothetical protein
MARLPLFAPIVPEHKQNPLYRAAADRGRAPARASLQAAFDGLPNPDGNFVKDFQTTGFSARIWELYLAAYVDSVGIALAQPHDRPDFLLSKGGIEIWLEATTANATGGDSGLVTEKPASNWDQGKEFALKIGSALFSKLTKRYWDLAHVAGMPLVIAVADFHDGDPFRATSGPLATYLYGTHLQVISQAGEHIRGKTHHIEAIRTDRKTIPAPFFKQPDTEHISAVLFSNAGTIAKFDRMAYDPAIYPDMRMLRWGYAFSSDVTAVAPEPFGYMVGDALEKWGQEVIIFHNPNALHPVPRTFFGDALQYISRDGREFHTHVDFHPLVSLTENYVGTPAIMERLEPQLRERAKKLVLGLHRRQTDLEASILSEHHDWTAD